MTDTRPAASICYRITVSPQRAELDAHGASVLRDIHELGLPHISRVASSRLFLLEGPVTIDHVARIANELLADPITERFDLLQGGDDRTLPGPDFDACVEVHLKGGVMDPVAESARAAIADMGIDISSLSISTSRLYRLKGVASLDEVEFIGRRLLSNDCIEDLYLTGFDRHDPRPDHLPIAPTSTFNIAHISIRELDDVGLTKLSREGHLFLSLEEMRTIQQHYCDQQRDPTDLELEMFAQTWSEHCVHKTLKSSVRYRGMPFPAPSHAKQTPIDNGVVEVVYDNLLKDTVARATHELIETGQVDWCLSVFVDNAGIITFDETHGVAFKVETHNHPSAIEPYGGAATGAGGCIRDVMGCGLGAKPIANTDIFCVGQPDFPMAALPKGVLHPRRVLKGVVSGVRDYGNRMGIPTVNGAILFDDRYLGNPLVFCGCVGLIPRNRIHKEPQPGDLIVVMGGRTGRDGIHGATFSSAELTDTHANEFSHAVQIGNAITEKQVLDAMLQARDHEDGCLYTATTDCGAGGLSSAVGEMGEKLGATVDLEKVPLKYAGLRYDEIWISEAQERMVISVPPANWEKVREICEAENVEATVIGSFRDDGRLLIRYDNQTVGDIDAAFLHGGVPTTRKDAVWKGNGVPAQLESTSCSSSDITAERQQIVAGNLREMLGSAWPAGSQFRDELVYRLSQLNTASKEWVIRQYDHEVQGASVVKSLAGPGEGPSDAAVLRPCLDSDRGVVLANGINSSLSDVDPYWMAVAGIDEAVRNIVCVGGDPNKTAILDNFCWGNCEDPQTMGALARACQGCYDAAITYGTPFISGKDSLNNEFALDPADAEHLANRIPLYNNRIRIPATLLISAVSVIDDVNRCVTMDAKQIDGQTTYFFYVGLTAKQWQDVDITQAAALHGAVAELIRSGSVLAAHDCGDEGCLLGLAEMAFAGRCGVDAAFGDPDPFASVPCGYLLQTCESDREAIAKIASQLSGILVKEIARSRDDNTFCWRKEINAHDKQDDEGFEIDLQTLSKAWRSSLNW